MRVSEKVAAERQHAKAAQPRRRAQRGSVAGSNGITHDGIVCCNCQETGHYASDSPTDANGGTDTGTSLVQHAYMLTQADATGIVDPEWILLDSQSTISVFGNPRMLTNIRGSDRRILRALTNGGHQDLYMVGDFPNLGEVWYNRITHTRLRTASCPSPKFAKCAASAPWTPHPTPLCTCTASMVQ